MGDGESAGRRVFLFTDIEGSTRLWERFPEGMPAALAQHDALLHEAVSAHGGTVFKTVGDAICAVFPLPAQAVLAAVEAQRQLSGAAWRDLGLPEPPKVRMAIHAGEVDVQERHGDFSGPVLNRLARLLAAGHGGQVLIAGPVAEQVQDTLPQDVELRDLGERRLRDVPGTERIYHLAISGLSSTFPPLKTLETIAHNLPVAPTPCIGREDELSRLRAIFPRSHVRLVTLLGPGGIGKTRLALQTATDLLDEFPDGVWIIDLTSVQESRLALGAVIRALGINEEAGRTTEEALVAWLGQRELLLVLDNCEQVIEGAAQLAFLTLREAPKVRLLATSRAPLDVRGEYRMPLEPLAFPGKEELPHFERIRESASVQVFVARASTARPSFALNATNASHVAEICRRVDGIPLALELAAARITVLSPEALRDRLDRRLPTLIAGARDLPDRHRTLRQAIAWSYDLLPEHEQTAFRRLAVFAGGWSMNAAESVLGEESDVDVLSILESLASQSLVRAEPDRSDEPRFSMLETIREFAVEKLQECGDEDEFRDGHARYFLETAERLAPDLYGQNLTASLARISVDYANYQTATARLATVQPELAQRICNALFRYWLVRGYLSEGISWYRRALEHSDADASETRAKALQSYGGIALHMSNYRLAAQAYQASLEIRLALGEKRGIALAQMGLGYLATEQGELNKARTFYGEALEALLPLGNSRDLAVCYMNLAMLSLTQHDIPAAHAELLETRRYYELAGDAYGAANAIIRLATTTRLSGDPVSAHGLVDEAQRAFLEFNDESGLAISLRERSLMLLEFGDCDAALRSAREALSHTMGIGDRKRGVECLDIVATCLTHMHEDHAAVQLFGSSVQLRRNLESMLTPHEKSIRMPPLAQLRSRLDPSDYEANWHAGQRMTLDDAVTLALGAEAAQPR